MPMIGDGVDVVVGVRVEVRAGLPLVSRTLDDVVQVRNHAGRAERLAVVVEIDAPRIAGSFGEDFELVPRGMISPNAALSGIRSRSGVPGLPTRECVNTPWQP